VSKKVNIVLKQRIAHHEKESKQQAVLMGKYGFFR